MESVTVVKLSPQGEALWSYEGRVLARGETFILLEAHFNREDTPFHGVLLRKGDPFHEIFYSDRWYNIFELVDQDTRVAKGWYCNVTRPAEFVDGQIRYVDLALDLLVYPDGRQLVLDEDEFEALQLDEAQQEQAQSALAELQRIVLPQQGFRVG